LIDLQTTIYGCGGTVKHSFLFVILVLGLFGCSQSENTAANTESNKPKKPPENLAKAVKAVEPFFKPMGKPAAYDWLASTMSRGRRLTNTSTAIRQNRQRTAKRSMSCR